MDKLLDFIIENIYGVVFLIDTEGKFKLSCGKGLKKLGLKQNEVVGLSIYDVYKDFPEITNSFTAALDGQTVRKKIAVNNIHFDVIFSPYFGDANKQTAVVGLATDITDCEAAKAQALDNEQIFKLVIDLAPECFLMGDTNGNIIYANNKVEEITGYPVKEILNKNISSIFTEESLSANPLRYDLLDSGKSVISEREIKRADGKIVTVQSNSKKMPNGTYVAFIRDISEIKKYQKHTQKTEKLDSLGYLASGIAHNFNNLMTGIFNYASLTEHTTKEEATLANMKKINTLIDKVKELTGKLLTFSKSEFIEKDFCNIEKTLANVCNQLIDNSKYILNNLIKTDTICYVAKKQIYLTFENIIKNAMESMPEGGTITLSSEKINLTDENSYALKKGEYLKIQITDTGSGIAKENINKISDPFFSTKPTNEGIGLTLAESILKKHKGTIICESTSDKGTTFDILLPTTQIA